MNKTNLKFVTLENLYYLFVVAMCMAMFPEFKTFMPLIIFGALFIAWIYKKLIIDLFLAPVWNKMIKELKQETFPHLKLRRESSIKFNRNPETFAEDKTRVEYPEEEITGHQRIC